MRGSQWSVIAVIFFLGMIFFIFMGNSAMKGQVLSMQTQTERTELGMGDIIFPLRSSLYFSFGFLCFLISSVGWINAWIESRAEKRGKSNA